MSVNTIRILYWNARSILQRKNELFDLLREVDIFICVESWLKSKDQFKVTGFNVIRQGRLNSRGGGILFLIRKALSFVLLKNISILNNKFELAGVRITNTAEY